MKTILLLLLLLTPAFNRAQGIQPAPPDKAVIYFVRPSSAGFAINFSYFDSTRLIGIFAGKGYFRYECEPGFHIFWARSENKDFVEANVEAGKIYLIEAIPQMGWVKAGVSLLPVDPAKPKKVVNVLKVINKKPPEVFTDELLNSETAQFSDVINRGISKYKEDKAAGVQFLKLEKEMNIKL